MPLQPRKGCVDTGLGASVQSVQLELRADEACRRERECPLGIGLVLSRTSNVLGVGSSSGTAAVDVVGDIVDLLTVLIAHNRSFCRPSIGTKHYSILTTQSWVIVGHEIDANTLKQTPTIVVPVFLNLGSLVPLSEADNMALLQQEEP